MREPTMRELRASRTHTERCSVLMRGAFDGPSVCVCWCHDEQRPKQAAPVPSATEDRHEPSVCPCGHRVGIHEYPGRCNGAVSWPDDNVTRCECWHDFSFEQIAADRGRPGETDVSEEADR